MFNAMVTIFIILFLLILAFTYRQKWLPAVSFGKKDSILFMI